MRRLRTSAILLLLLGASLPLHAAKRVVLLHFSDYHSHALPFYSEGKPDQGGFARAIGYLKAQKRAGALVFSGGDMINKGSPAWSDKYGCVEWSWLSGVVDAMALGNHDADYGAESFSRCRLSSDYPILSANTEGLPPYRVFTRGGVRIGIFAVAGDEFPALMNDSGFRFSDRIAAARSAVEQLRTREHVAAVVMIGHETTSEDLALAREVKGIDLIFGTHSHEKHALRKIPGTSTWFVSPSQYLTYISRVELTIDRGRVTAVRGGLVPVNRQMASDAGTQAKIEQLERNLESDPKYAPLFQKIGSIAKGLDIPALARQTLDVMKESTKADLALSTVSSFRQALPAGPLTPELLRAALPYDNEIVVCELRGTRVAELLAFVEKNRERDPALVSSVSSVDAARAYRVATTDYLARVAAGYREYFGPCDGRTGLRVREQVRKSLTGNAVP